MEIQAGKLRIGETSTNICADRVNLQVIGRRNGGALSIMASVWYVLFSCESMRANCHLYVTNIGKEKAYSKKTIQCRYGFIQHKC